MSYQIKSGGSIEKDIPLSDYKIILEIADNACNYLKEKKAILVTGPGELCKETITTRNNEDYWVYHLDNTTLFYGTKPVRVGLEKLIRITFTTVGMNSKQILSDLKNILK